MIVLYKFVSFVYRLLASISGKDPVEYLAEISAHDGISQAKFNLMLDRLEFS